VLNFHFVSIISVRLTPLWEKVRIRILTNGSGSGRPKNMRIRFRIRNTANTHSLSYVPPTLSDKRCRLGGVYAVWGGQQAAPLPGWGPGQGGQWRWPPLQIWQAYQGLEADRWRPEHPTGYCNVAYFVCFFVILCQKCLFCKLLYCPFSVSSFMLTVANNSFVNINTNFSPSFSLCFFCSRTTRRLIDQMDYWSQSNEKIKGDVTSSSNILVDWRACTATPQRGLGWL